MSRFLVLICLILGSSYSLAAGRHPQIFWQPSGGQIVASLSYLYETINIDETLSTVASNESGIGQGAELEIDYGLFRLLSLGVGFNWKRLDTEVKASEAVTFKKQEGPGDWNFNMKLVLPLTRTRLYLGAEYNLSTANNIQRGSNPQFFNRLSGGNSIVGIAGAQMPMGPLWIGIKAKMTVLEERTLEVNGTETSKLTDGGILNVLANFEAHSNTTVFGIGAGVFQKQKETSTNIATQVATTTQSIDKVHFTLYYSYRLPWMTVLLEGNYFSGSEAELNTTDIRLASTELDSKVTLRFAY